MLKQWQEILQMIVQRLQLAETYGKIMDNVQKLEINLQKSKLPHEHEEQIFHRKEDLQQHIENLKVILFNATLFSDLTQPRAVKFRLFIDVFPDPFLKIVFPQKTFELSRNLLGIPSIIVSRVQTKIIDILSI